MSTYDTLRHSRTAGAFSPMFVFFVGCGLFAFRPGSKARYEEAAQIPLKNGSED